MYGLHDNQAHKYEFPSSEIDSPIAFGDLPYAVIGIVQGKLQIFDLNDFFKCPTTKDLFTFTFEDAMEAATKRHLS
jgi:hypothetical protein